MSLDQGITNLNPIEQEIRNRELQSEKTLVHLNSDALCGVAIITTGDDPKKHDLVELCVMELNNFFVKKKGTVPFNIELQPINKEIYQLNNNNEKLKISREKLLRCQIHGLEPSMAADLFDSWFNKLNLKKGKKIAPLCYNWPHISSFLKVWLGPENFNYYFDYRYRDLLPAALYYNDKTDSLGEQIMFPKLKMKYITSQVDVMCDRTQDTLQEVVNVCETYKRIMRTTF